MVMDNVRPHLNNIYEQLPSEDKEKIDYFFQKVLPNIVETFEKFVRMIDNGDDIFVAIN